MLNLIVWNKKLQNHTQVGKLHIWQKLYQKSPKKQLKNCIPWNIWALLLWFLNVPTLYFSKMFIMILNLIIVIKQFKHIYRHCHMPRTMWMLMKHLGARPAWSHPRTKERGNTLARRTSWTPIRQAVPHHGNPHFSNFLLLSVCFCYLCQWSVMLPESPEWLLWTECSANCQIWGRKTALDPWLY